MSDMWVTRPGEEHLLSAMGEVASRLHSELESIRRVGDDQGCRVCGTREPLTKEHTPSKKAGNPMRAMRGSIDYSRSRERGEVTWVSELIQGGVTTLSLCSRCNNSTGRWYNAAYVKLAKYCAPLAIPANAGAMSDVRLTIHPQRVLKQH